MNAGFGLDPSIGKVDGWTALAPAGNIQGQETSSKAGQKSGDYMSDHAPEGKRQERRKAG